MGFFEEITLMPTAIFTTLMCVVLGYWAFVLIGALDMDFLGGADAGDGLDVGGGDVDIDVGGGDVDIGAGGGDVDVDVGDAGGDADVDIGDGDADVGAGSFDLLGALKLRSVPLTVSISFLVMWAWLLCYAGMHFLGPALVDAIPGWVTGAGVSALSLVGSLFLSSATVRPFAPIFRTHSARTRRSLLGEVVTITTGRVDKDFGQARHDDGEAGSLLTVRCDAEDLTLGRGDKALIIDYDEVREVFIVEPAMHLLDDEIGRGSTP